MATLSVIVHTKNSAVTLEACLTSVRPLADELIVMDMMSTDESRQIARQFRAKVMRHPDVGFVEPARDSAIQAATSDWILIVDADETIPQELGKKIHQLIEEESDVVAYALPRKNMIFGQWARSGWWPDYQWRLFKRGHVQWPAKLHAYPQIEGEKMKLPAEENLAIIHQNYTDIDAFVDRAQRYSSIASEEVLKSTRTVEANIFRTLMNEILRRWFVSKAHEQGQYGQALTMLQSYFEVLVLVKTWEQQKFSPRQPAPSLSRELWLAFRQARYWEAQYNMENSSGLSKLYWQIRRKLKL
jgi:(heptosyl)LPS beta-1,4-glucosyltransferase